MKTKGKHGSRRKTTKITEYKSSNKVDLSVIIPAYNLEDCVSDCLDSVIAQKIDKLQVIVVDDCSNDHTWEILQAYAEKHPQISIIQHTENKGPSGARNTALELAEGEFIHFCDGDDSVPEGAYHEMLRIAMEKKADIVTGNYSRMYPNENGAIRPFSHYSSPTGIERCFESGNTTLWNKIFRRSMIEEDHLRFDESMAQYEDYLFYSQFILKNPITAFTDMYVYIYTEPITRPLAGQIRYANISCARNIERAWRTIFQTEIARNQQLWFMAYQHNLDWYFNCSWKLIQNPEERQEAFEIMRGLVSWVEKNVKFCSWGLEERAQAFYHIFHVDYLTLCSIRYEDYLLHLAILDNIHPRGPAAVSEERLKKLSFEERDRKLCQSIEKQLDDLETTYQAVHTNKRIWKDHYWNLMDSVVNDYWRQLQGAEERDRFFQRIRATNTVIYEKNQFLRLSSPDDVQRFKQIFCVDAATLYALNYSQYMAVCSPRFIAIGGSGGGASGYVPDPITAFISACRCGNVGMRAILRSIKAWVAFKLARKKK